MKVLTLWRPWPYTFFRLKKEDLKDIENRSWKPPASIIGERIALHAGKTWDNDGAHFIMGAVNPDPAESVLLAAKMATAFPAGYIIGTVRVTGYFWIDEMFQETDSKWAFGPCCWKVEDPNEFDKLIPYSGRQGLWECPELESVVLSCSGKRIES